MSVTNGVPRQLRRLGLALVLLGALHATGDRAGPSDNVSTLSAVEARILVYISPVGQRQREQGTDIAMEAQSSAQLNQADYYYFWVYDAKRREPSGSVTVGYYAVNRHTADVWDADLREPVSSRVLSGVQAIIRESRHIDRGTIEKYRSRPF